MLTQIELELEMYAFGKSRANKMMSRNEDAGSADNNPYAKAILNRYVLPLAATIRADITEKRAGRNQAHVTLLEPLDPEAVAFLAVRGVLNDLMAGRSGLTQAGNSDDAGAGWGTSVRTMMTTIGKAAYHELLLSLFSEIAPDLFYTLVNDLGRRLSKSERHRTRVFKLQAAQAGISFPEWGAAGTQQVGAYLLDQLSDLGMVEIRKATMSNANKRLVRNTMDVKLTGQALDVIGNIRQMVAENTPYYLPCIEPPRDWLGIADGGFHTNEMRRMQPFAIKSPGGWSELEEHDLTIPLTAINRLQRTPWQINGKMLDATRLVAKHFDMEEILSQAEYPAPPRPDWLVGDMKVEHMSPDEQEEFKIWKRAKAEWFTQMKLRGTKYGRFYTATTVADKFRQFPEIFFVYFADFRGRLYAQTTGVSPQGSDLQKALIRFAKGEPLDSESAKRWFCIHGANKFGYDKASLDDRVKWVADRHDQIMSFADSPVDNRDWQDADSPLQFLAWCQEYAEWQTNPDEFLSHIPIGMDGSCNGLQNFSAMLRDEVGGKATNLVPGALPNDIYQMVADVAAAKLRAARVIPIPEDDETAETFKAIRKATNANKFRPMWLAHGLNRSLVKRSVMTLPYGSTRFSCSDFIAGDYLKAGKAPEFSKDEYGPAAQYLSHFVWDSIGEVVVKAREAMDYLQRNSKNILKDNDAIRWVTPSGFPVAQFYQKEQLHRINTKLAGNTKIRVKTALPEADPHRHRNGIAPNFIHSHDAAHLHLVTVAAGKHGMDLAMIHDDYGTHAKNAESLYRIIREEFVRMYEAHDPLADFAALYDLPAPPEKGNLNLQDVLRSPYFFS